MGYGSGGNVVVGSCDYPGKNCLIKVGASYEKDEWARKDNEMVEAEKERTSLAERRQERIWRNSRDAASRIYRGSDAGAWLVFG